MSTDKTLAEVQPGGRVRLGDQAERARFEAWAEERELGTAKCSADGMKGDYADLNTDWCWAAWRAALSARPSPGGQDALVREALDYFERAGDAGDRKYVAAIRAALAARQPVTMDDALAAGDGTLHGAIDHWQERALRAEAELAARQPVRSSTVSDDMMDVVDRLGSEHDEVDPRAWDHMLIYAPTEKLAARLTARQPVDEVSVKKEDANNYCLILRALGMEEEGDPVAEVQALIEARDRQPVGEQGHLRQAIATVCEGWTLPTDARKILEKAMWEHVPPAQAVDLGQFVPDPKTVPDCFAEDDSDAQYNSGWNDCRDAVLALIDSKAVGNG